MQPQLEALTFDSTMEILPNEILETYTDILPREFAVRPHVVVQEYTGNQIAFNLGDPRTDDSRRGLEEDKLARNLCSKIKSSMSELISDLARNVILVFQIIIHHESVAYHWPKDIGQPSSQKTATDTLQGNSNLPFHHRVMSRLTRWGMTNGTTKVFNHGLKSIVLITIHRRRGFICTSSDTEEVEMVIRLFIFQRAKRHEPPILRVNTMEDDCILEPTHTERLVHLGDGKLVHRDDVLFTTVILTGK